MAPSSVEDPEYEDYLEEKENNDSLENLPLSKSLVRMHGRVRNGGRGVADDTADVPSCSCSCSQTTDGHVPRESPARSARAKDKRGRAGKGNPRKDKRRMRDRRKSSGLVYLKSTGESTGDDETDVTESRREEVKRAGSHGREVVEDEFVENACHGTLYLRRGGKSPSDLEADCEDNRESDSVSSLSACLPISPKKTPLLAGEEDTAISHPENNDASECSPLLEQERESNRELSSRLQVGEQRVAELEYKITTLTTTIERLSLENEQLREENGDLRDENKAILSSSRKLSSND
ncbi:PREDICTED: uncharacterized protein LOC106813051 [Priapulus caudatus]|uniref:Uncharacterized protein LOC106813051 n=1 Tax=Priapulus caudatus TaxID=37621 RepID=A0ABM1EK64_PRICU|nr:PREDICTED: uncharacterized protein LOC106813051 [Priapulus caudatus]